MPARKEASWGASRSTSLTIPSTTPTPLHTRPSHIGRVLIWPKIIRRAEFTERPPVPARLTASAEPARVPTVSQVSCPRSCRRYGTEVLAVVRSMNLTSFQTTVGCPWQNGIAERFVGSCRRHQRIASKTAARQLRQVLPRGSHPTVDLESKPPKNGHPALVAERWSSGLVLVVFIIVTNSSLDRIRRQFSSRA